ncbi:hypothetical protein BSK65_07590 [Paenibacillus odorifer]|uniref:Uncharacterized protein n=1 Tax=Paenibacillus odorifer TaxID=189426 RepID=A0A1R0ZKB9_9BACL|nr:hypothetical protein [Paenibacillus odorifer]OMD52797.1 hypothetical protein BSK51_11200 [Paenibacillus odorifer]OME72226.1 hypothetical protein BSK65_07590 [Paenibacillus odorifer]
MGYFYFRNPYYVCPGRSFPPFQPMTPGGMQSGGPMPIYPGSGTQLPGMQTHSSGGPVFAYLTITDIQPFLGKWGIFTLSSGQKVVAYVNTVNADSISVLFADGKSAVIDVKMISMAEGPFPTMPATPGSGSGGGPGSGSGSGSGSGPGNCTWKEIPGLGWICI